MSELIQKNANEQLNEIRKSMQDLKIEFNKETQDTDKQPTPRPYRLVRFQEQFPFQYNVHPCGHWKLLGVAQWHGEKSYRKRMEMQQVLRPARCTGDLLGPAWCWLFEARLLDYHSIGPRAHPKLLNVYNPKCSERTRIHAPFSLLPVFASSPFLSNVQLRALGSTAEQHGLVNDTVGKEVAWDAKPSKVGP